MPRWSWGPGSFHCRSVIRAKLGLLQQECVRILYWGVGVREDSQLSKASLLVRATDETELSDFGEDSWEEGLDRLVHSLHAEGDLSEVGEGVAAAMIADFLKSRLWVVDWHHRHPEIGT